MIMRKLNKTIIVIITVITYYSFVVLQFSFQLRKSHYKAGG